MKKKHYVQFIKIIIFSLILSTLSANVNAIKPSELGEFSSYDYVIDSYNVDIVVHDDNTYDISEDITVYFNTPKHGIYRNIPLKSKIIRSDGSTSNYRASITNLMTNDNYRTYRQQGYLILKLGSLNSLVTGEQLYKINYKYSVGKDTLKNKDEFYYNIIGTDWDTVIGNVTFTITMPKEFDSSKLGFSYGKNGEKNTDGISYNIEGNKIIGSLEKVLYQNEGLTVRCELEEGYFANAKSIVSVLFLIIYSTPLLLIGLSLFLWYKYGREDIVVETVEFYPPEGLNSLDVGFIYNGELRKKDIISLLIYLANKGYIKITEIDQMAVLDRISHFKVTKLKEYDGTDENERLFLEGLFSERTSIGLIFNNEDGINEVKEEDLRNSFYKTVEKITDNVNSNSYKNKILEKKSTSMKKLVLLVTSLCICVVSMVPFYEYGNYENLFDYITNLVGASAITVFFFYILYLLLHGKITKIRVKDGTTYGNPVYIWMLVIMILFWYVFLPWYKVMYEPLIYDRLYLLGYIYGLICSFIIVIIFSFIPKRTKYANDIYGRIKGFVNFLETCGMDKLKTIIKEKPTYFYDILPFLYVLNITDECVKKFEKINISPPVWYDSKSDFTVREFKTSIDTAFTSAQSTMTSVPYSVSTDAGGGSSFTGGGFSGGGFGGGGGGSW